MERRSAVPRKLVIPHNGLKIVLTPVTTISWEWEVVDNLEQNILVDGEKDDLNGAYTIAKFAADSIDTRKERK